MSSRRAPGFRKTEFGDGMVKLNDRVVQLKGYAQRTTNEWPALGIVGAAVGERLQQPPDGRVAARNLVRWMHVTPWKQDVESCDRVGLMQAMPAGDSEKDVDGPPLGAARRSDARRRSSTTATIPASSSTSRGNKGISDEHMRRDEGRPRPVRPARRARYRARREMLDSSVAEYGGEMLYINKSARHALLGDGVFARRRRSANTGTSSRRPSTRTAKGRCTTGRTPSAYNRNQDSHAVENVVRWYDYWRERPGTGARVNAGGVNIIFSDSNTHHRGAENYRRSGEVDAVRLPKDGFFAHQVMWDGWVDVERPRAHIVGHWNYGPARRRTSTSFRAPTRSSCSSTASRSASASRASRFLSPSRTSQWQPGTLTAVGYDAAGKKVAEASKKTGGRARRASA